MALRRRALAAVLAAAAAWLAAAAAPAHGAIVGVATDTTWGISSADMDRTVSLEQAAGVRWVRESASWTAIEKDGKGQFNSSWIAQVDAAIAKDVAAGFDVVMYIDQVPYWASGDPDKYVDGSGTKRWNKYWRPANVQDYADFVRWVVARYSARGVRAFELWNEPNHSRFWPSGPNAAQYVELLRAGYAAAKQANPDAIVTMAGLSPDGHVPLYDFLSQMYAAGAGAYTDRVVVHEYPSGDPTVCWNDASGRPSVKALCGLREVERIAAANGDAGKRIWLTEIGWSSCGQVSSSCWGVTEAQQADYLTKAYRTLATDHPSVEIAFWYQFRNSYWNVDPASWGTNLGLVHQDFSPKPAYEALRAYATAEPAPPPPPSEEPPPPPAEEPPAEEPPPPPPPPALAVSITSPADGATFARSLSLAASTTGEVARVEFLFDGRRVATDHSAPYAASYTVPKRTAYGDHVVTAVAYGPAGDSVRAQVTVRRVDSRARTASRRRAFSPRRCRSRARTRAARARCGTARRARAQR